MQILFKHSKVILTVLFFSFYFKPYAQQNLVFNPSFEQLDTCLVLQPATMSFNYYGWYSFSSGDIYSPCFGEIDTYSGVPQNYLGFQYPHSGNNYAGVQTLTYTGGDFRDYITGYLKDSLKLNKKHCVSFYVSLVDTLNTACNSFGVALTSSIPTTGFGQGLFSLTPQIQNQPSSNPLTDRINWTEIKGSFIANGNEKYVTIGNFLPNFLSDTTRLIYPLVELPGLPPYTSYIYLDDVLVYELKALENKDTLVCRQATFNQTLNAFSGFDTYQWNTGDTSRTLNITSPGTYWVTATNWCGTTTDTVVVQELDTTLFANILPPNIFVCQENLPISIELTPTLQSYFYNQTWSNGDTLAFTSINNPQTITVTANYLCGTAKDSISIATYPQAQVNLGQDTTLCIGQSLNLNAGNFRAYTWNTQDTTASILLSISGNYFVQATDTNNCTAKDSINIIFEQATYNFLPQDTAVYKWQLPITVSVPQDFTNILWLDGTNQQSTQIANAGIFSVVAKDAGGCNVEDSIRVTLKKQNIILPTINTLGQTFIIKNLPPNNVLKIYDGLGKLIYYEQNYTNNKQLVLSNAVYFISLEYKNDNNEQDVLVGKLLGME
jgi:hypothetical protein